MRIESKRITPQYIIAATIAFGVLLLAFMVTPRVQAEPQSGERLITVYDRGTERGLITEKDTLREVFDEAGIALDKNDFVEPAIDEKLVTNSYQVNIYRARPVVIVDGNVQQLVMSAHQTPQQIASHAGIELRDEDEAEVALSDNMIRDGAGLRMVVDRATPVKLTLYGKKETVYTQATDIASFLEEKNISLGPKDDMSKPENTAITSGMSLNIWRNGKQTITVEEKINFETEQIQDTNRDVGYKKVNIVGKVGEKMVTYEIVMRNGREVSRKVIQTVVTKQPTAQVEVVGSKPSFSGAFGDALAKLRSCEGSYDSWNPAGPYYGAYQFNQGTWSSVSDAPYGNATPAQQDAAARALYERRGWQPWPHCGAGLPDIYR